MALDGARPTLDGVRRVVWEYVARRFLANDFYHDAARCHERALISVGPDS
jgi:hypothetical protein